MENSAFKNKFKTFLQKTPKINFDFNRQDGLASPGADGSRIPEEWAGLQLGDEVAMQDLVAARDAASESIMKLPVTRVGTRVVLEVPVKTETVARAHQLRVANEALWGAFTARP